VILLDPVGHHLFLDFLLVVVLEAAKGRNPLEKLRAVLEVADHIVIILEVLVAEVKVTMTTAVQVAVVQDVMEMVLLAMSHSQRSAEVAMAVHHRAVEVEHQRRGWRSSVMVARTPAVEVRL
jgi:hypothetical protein